MPPQEPNSLNTVESHQQSFSKKYWLYVAILVVVVFTVLYFIPNRDVNDNVSEELKAQDIDLLWGSGENLRLYSDGSISWIDNNRLVFRKENVVRDPGIYLFDSFTRAIEKIPGTELYSPSCFDGRYLQDMRWVGNGYELWQLDTQTMTAEITPEASSTSHFNSNTCFLPEKLPPSLDNKGYNPIVRLRAGDGFFLGKGSKETPYQSIQVFLTTPDGSQIKPTGLKVQEDKCSLPSPIWISFVGKYFIADYTCITPENAAVIPSDVYTPVATKGWWLSSDGSSEPADFMIPQEILLPSDVITDGNVFVDPVARGFLITTTQRPYKETESAQAGVYLLKSDGSFSKLLSGFSRRPVITPDGCKAAFGVQDKMNYNPLAGVYTLSEPELTVLDLCTEQSP